MEPVNKKSIVLSKVDNILSNPNLLNQPKSILLLHVYKLTKILLPELATVYWDQLLKTGNHLPDKYKDEYKELLKSSGPEKTQPHGKFQDEIISGIENARQKKENEPAKSKELLLDCRLKIEKRWWPFGNRSLWILLIPELFEIDRKEALMLIRKLPTITRKNYIIKWNKQTPLSAEEWILLNNTLKNSLLGILEELLDEDGHILNISGETVASLGSRLIRNIHFINAGDASESGKAQAETIRAKGLNRFKSLVISVNKKFPDDAELLMESLCLETMTSNLYTSSKEWADRFSAIRNVLNYWNLYPDQKEKATIFLKNKTPKYLKGFVLSHWYSITAISDEAAIEAFNTLAQEPDGILESQAWFLIMLVNQDKGHLAYKLSQQSVNPTELTPRILRTWITINSHDVLKQVPPESLPQDIISRFLLLQTLEEQLEFLRTNTSNGNDPLPKEMWKLPDYVKLLSNMSSPGFLPLDSEEHLFTTFYYKTEKKETQLNSYLKQFGFGQYTYSEIDSKILKALNFWEVTYPEEVTNLFQKLWMGFIPPMSIIQMDLFRNMLFERYRIIFSAHPESLQKFFISWIQKELVDKSLQWVIGQTTYTFSLKDVAAFIFCIQSANAISGISPKKCDQILMDAIKNHLSDTDLMNSAAALYASDKESMPIDPPSTLKSKNLLKDWQSGVIEGSLKKLTNSLITEVSENNPVL